MAMNLGLTALLSWVNSLKLSERDMTVDDLQDGIVLLKVVYMLKKEPNSCVSNTIKDRFQFIADFVERDCRFNAAKGTSLSWDNIKDGMHLTVEISKVLLLLVYYDMMNDRCTLNMMECESEREIANLTGCYVMESDGCVYLNKELDAYLARRLMSVPCKVERRPVYSLSSDDSPVVHRRQKVSFMDMQTVASSSTSKSPLQDIMNTPKFQLRKMQREMIKERDYKDGLVRELASNLALLTQRDSHIRQLQYRLEKLKEAYGDRENVIGQQINELQTKKNTLQMRLNEMLKENKDLKGNTSLMERKVDELADENGVLSSQVRTVCSQLAYFEAEVGRLNETQASSKKEWTSETGQLQSELKQATAQKELLGEQLQILQGKISCLEDDINMATKEEVGENMGPIMEKDLLNTLREEIDILTHETMNNTNEIQAKEEKLAKLLLEKSNEQNIFQKEIQALNVRVEDLSSSLKQAEQEIRLKQELLAKTQHENVQHILQIEALGKQRAVLEEEVNWLREETTTKESKLELLKVENGKESEMLQNEIQTLRDQVQRLNDSLKTTVEQAQAKENLLTLKEIEISQENDKFQDMMTNSAKEIQGLREQIQAKEEHMVKLEQEGSTQSDMLQQEIKCLKTQLSDMGDSLTEAQKKVQTQLVMLTKQEQESADQKELLQHQLSASEEEVRKMKEEIQATEEQVILLKSDGSEQSDLLHQEITILKMQVETLGSSLRKAEEDVHSKEDLLAQKEQDNIQQVETLQSLQEKVKQVEILQEQISSRKDEIQNLKESRSEKESHILKAEEKLQILQTELCAFNQLLTDKDQNLNTLREEVTAQANLIKKTREEAEAKEKMLTDIKKACSNQTDDLQHEIQVLKEKVETTSQGLLDKEQMLLEAQKESSEQTGILQQQLASVNAELDQYKETQAVEIRVKETEQAVTFREKEALVQEKEVLMARILQTENNQKALEKQHEAVVFEKDRLAQATQAMERNNKEDEIQKLIESQSEKESHILKAEEKLQILQTELCAFNQLLTDKDQHLNTLREEVTAQANLIKKTREEAEATQAMERDNKSSHKLESLLQHEMEILKKEKEILLKEKEKADETQTLKKDLQEQLSAKSEAAEHYKAQMEKAMSHYNGKKQLLQESQEEAIKLKQSLEVKEHEVNDTTMENHLLQLDFDKAQTNEKALLNKVASLEAQLVFADRNLRAQNKFHGNEGSSLTSLNMEVPNTHSSVNTKAKEKKAISSDSLDYSSMEDSLNNTRKLLAPDESSTPLVRSSERLAAKHRGLQAEYLETLYFTPINSRQINRVNAEHTHKLDSTRKNPTSSVKRRRTTQVINITLTKKTPGDGEHDDTFYSLASARSHPNISSAHSARPVSMTLFDTPARLTGAASDQLIGLPGYRRSTMHSQPASTFYAGDENESDGGTDDWMRIAELQARNKAVLPHLKSSYPVESDPCRGATFLFTDEELRTGDPSDTIRRGSTMPGQLQDSLASHRHSLMVGHSAAAANTRSHRLSLMPELPSKTVGSSQLRSPKGTKRSSSTLSVHQTSPEKKVRASCFPRPLTPKAKNVMSEPFNSQIRTALSPVDRRQSMMFSIDNTPQKTSNFLTKNINKLRSSTRKSPGKTSKKSPAQKSVRKNENNPAADSRAGVARTGKIGSSKSPQVATKGQKATSRSAKSPGLSNARKMMSRMKV